MKLTTIFIILVLLSIFKTDDNNQDTLQTQNDKLEDQQESSNNTDKQIQEKEDNKSNNTIQNKIQDKNIEQDGTPQFIDKEIENPYKRQSKSINPFYQKQESTLVHDQIQNQDRNLNYRQNAIKITKLNAPIELNQEYQFKKSVTFSLTENTVLDTLIVHVSNISRLRYSQVLVKEFIDENKDMQIPISPDLLKQFKGGYIEFIAKRQFQNVLKLTQQKIFEMKFGENVNLKTQLVDNMLFDIKASNTQKNDKQRYQFILQTDLDEVQLNGDEKVDFYVNFNKENPTEQKHDFKASGNIGHSLIKTINKNSKYFCNEDECHYKVLMILKNIDKVSFFPSEFPNESIIQFKKNMHLIEELEKNEIVTYVIEVPNGKDDWVFRKVPTQEDIKFYVNPEFKPDTLDQYQYKGQELGSEDLIITEKELKNNKTSLTKFYLTFESKSQKRAAVFEFKIYKIKSIQSHQITLNTYQTGVINGKELITYTLDLKTDQPQTHSINLKLYSYNGNSDLYVKFCESAMSCSIRNTDINYLFKNKNNESNSNDIYRFSNQDIKQDDGTYLDQLLLQYNCLPEKTSDTNKNSQQMMQSFAQRQYQKQQDNSQQKFNNNFRTLTICRIAIGIQNRVVEQDQKSMFKLIAIGQGDQKSLNLSESVTIQQNENEDTIFKIQLQQEQIDKNKFFKLQAIALTGSCEIYLSTKSKKPTFEDNEGIIIFQETFENNIHTFSRQVIIALDTLDSSQSIYIRVLAKKFSIVELIPNLLQRFNSNNTEKINMDQLYSRQLQRNQSIRVNRDLYYYYSFYYKFEEKPKNDEILEFTLNSDKDKLSLCIQDKTKDINFNNICAYHSEMKVLEIDNVDRRYQQGDEIAIGVYLLQNSNQYEIFPINFSLTMTAYKIGKKNEKIELFQPGVIFTKKLKSKAELFFSLNFSQIKNNGFIALTAQHIGITADIYLKEEQATKGIQALANLNHTNFAYEIQNIESIKWQNNIQKNLFVVIKNNSEKETRFSFVYSHDNMPIQLVEGVGLFLPSDIEHFFMYKQKQLQQSININFACERTYFESFAKIFGRSDIFLSKMEEETKTHSDFKTDLNNKAEIFVEQKILQKQQGAIVIANYQPKQGYNNMLVNQTISVSEKLTVTFDNGIKQIYPFEYVKNYGYKGEYKYFYFIVDEPQNILVNLVIDSGESDLYINKGRTHPTRQQYWKRSATKKGDQIEISTSDFENEKSMIGIYTVGVYSREYSQFELVYVPSQENFYHLKFQKVINLQLEPNQDYYLQFHNKYESFTTMMYADENVHVDVLDYDEKNKFDFLSYILNDQNYGQHFEFSKGNPPRVKFLDNAGTNLEFFVIKLNVQKTTQFMFCIFDVNKPVEIQSEKRFDLSLDENQEAIFEVKLDSDYQMADIDIRLKFGNIKFAVSDKQDEYNEWDNLDKPNQVYKELMMEKDDKQSDIIIFKQVFIKVSAQKLSSFSILVKPKNKYKQLRQFETEMIYTNSQNDQYLYYYVSKKDKESTKELEFNLHMIQTYLDRPELLFVADDDFSLKGDNSFLPMPIISVIDKEFEENKSQIITAQVTQGFYVIKIRKNTEKIPIKISVQINNQKSLDLNGLRKELQPINQGNKHYYYMYIPEPGRFRVILESCKHVVLQDPIFIEENQSQKALPISEDFYEAQKFAQIEYEDKQQKLQHEQLELKLYRGETDSKGIFKFSVTQSKSYLNDYRNKDIFYEIITEFQPKSQELVLKDYIDIFKEDKKQEQNQFTYFFDRSKNLVITFDRPNLKPQIKEDFPNVRKIRMIFYLQLSQYNSNKSIRTMINQCGLSSLNEIQGWSQKTERIVYTNDLTDNEKVQFIVEAQNMKQFSSSNFVEAFVTMKLHFVENEEDYYGISIDTKSVKLPYFEMIIPNADKSSNIFRNIFILMIFIIIVYLIYSKILKKKQSYNTHQRVPTKNQNYDLSQRGSRKKGQLELSKITTDPDH